jgi:hypothetical protein
MRTVKIIIAVVLFLISLFSLIAAIASFSDKEIGSGAGVVFIIAAGLLTLLGIRLIKKPSGNFEKPVIIKQPETGKKTFREKMAEINKNMEEKKKQAAEHQERQRQEFESGIGNSVFIEYEDNHGNFTDRAIDIKNVYEKNGQLYIYAYCYMKDANRTFLVDRILSMKDKRGGKKIKDIAAFLNRLSKTPPPADVSSEDLAAQALE